MAAHLGFIVVHHATSLLCDVWTIPGYFAALISTHSSVFSQRM